MTKINERHVSEYLNQGMYFAGRTAEYKHAPLPIDVEEMYFEYVAISLTNCIGTEADNVKAFMMRVFKNAFKMAVRYVKAQKRGESLYINPENTDHNLMSLGDVYGSAGWDEMVHHDEVRASDTGYPVESKFQELAKDFSKKDMAVIDLLMAGSKQKEIAEDLGMGLRSVERTMAKLKDFGYVKPLAKQPKPQSLPSQTLEYFYLNEEVKYDSWNNFSGNFGESGGFGKFLHLT